MRPGGWWSELIALRGLSDFEAIEGWCTDAESQDAKDMWRANVKRFGDLVRSRVTQANPVRLAAPPEEGHRTYYYSVSHRSRHCRNSHHVPLYESSVVCYDVSGQCGPAEEIEESCCAPEDHFDEEIATAEIEAWLNEGLLDELPFHPDAELRCEVIENLPLPHSAVPNHAWDLRWMLMYHAGCGSLVHYPEADMLLDLIEAQTTELPPATDDEIVEEPVVSVKLWHLLSRARTAVRCMSAAFWGY